MNPIAEEMASYLGQATMTDDEFLEHYGMPRRSGRYPWGSGEDPQRNPDFLSRVEELKKNGWEETTENIMKEFGMTSSEFRREKSICKDQRRSYQVATAKSLREDGLNNSEIGRRMGVGESTVRSWFNEESEARMNQAQKTADFLREQVDKKKMIDVGKGVELDLGQDLRVSRTKFETALKILEEEGYVVHGNRVPQQNNKNQLTTQKVLCVPGTPKSAIYEYDKIKTINDYISRDGGDTFEKKFTYPTSMDSNRLQIRYKEDGGELKDGIIELRRGVPDLSLGESRYSQVRILVDDTHYLKGMAVYSDDMPDGVDVIFNTNKGKDKSKMEVLKKIKNDPDNPFGSAIKDANLGGQYWYDPKTGEKVSSSHPNAKLGLINKRSDEGDWTEWKDTLPSQFLAKQSKYMAKKQLDLAKADKAVEFEEIMSLTNPTLKKHYLDKFASGCDAAAVDLKAAALPKQKYHVIIPINSLKDTEVYAPQYESGTKLALIRYPHGGTFEIPILTVNNKNKDAEKWIGSSSIDGIGITKKVADQLSGADFDGDTVMCIPTHDKRGKVKISSRDELKGLRGFDPKLEYGTEERVKPDGSIGYYRGDKEIKVMKATNTQMGIISNLITDMTLAGANDDELAAAVRHSMVVIDAEKHKLDYQQSAMDNNIAALHKKYQRKYDENGNELDAGGGASTIISKAKGQIAVPKRKGQARINVEGKPWYDPNRPEGSLVYFNADDKDLYYPQYEYNKDTGIKMIKTIGSKHNYINPKTGKERYGYAISYDMNDKKAREKYEPVMSRDPDTGDIIFTSKDGSITYKYKTRTVYSTNMAETDDAMTLVSPKKHLMELLYADYANSMKAMANKARIEMINTPNLKYDSTAAKIYKEEVSSLNAKLNTAEKNAPKERLAQRLATTETNKYKEKYPETKPDDLQKLSQRYLNKFRNEVGAISRRDRNIKITDREWEAIQAGAITNEKLVRILKNSDPDSLRERAMPKATKSLSTAQINRIKRLSDSDFTLEQIAKKMNVSTTTISKYLKGAK